MPCFKLYSKKETFAVNLFTPKELFQVHFRSCPSQMNSFKRALWDYVFSLMFDLSSTFFLSCPDVLLSSLFLKYWSIHFIWDISWYLYLSFMFITSRLEGCIEWIHFLSKREVKRLSPSQPRNTGYKENGKLIWDQLWF